MKILFTKNYGEEKFEKIKELEYDIIYYPEKYVTNNINTNSVDILVNYNPFNTLDICEIINLKYIQTTRVGIVKYQKRSY